MGFGLNVLPTNGAFYLPLHPFIDTVRAETVGTVQGDRLRWVWKDTNHSCYAYFLKASFQGQKESELQFHLEGLQRVLESSLVMENFKLLIRQLISSFLKGHKLS